MEPVIPSPTEVVDAWQDAVQAAELTERLATAARQAFEESQPLEPPSATLGALAARVTQAASAAAMQASLFERLRAEPT